MVPIIIQVSTLNESIENRCQRMIRGKSQLAYLIDRLVSKYNGYVIIAATNSPQDDVIEKIANERHVNVYRGEYSDVLARLLGCAHTLKADNFVRVLGNYPLIDIEQMDELVRDHIEGQYDYSYNEHRRGVLWGTGCEVFRTKMLEILDEQLTDTYQREMIAFYLQQHSPKYHIYKKEVLRTRPGYKLNLETEDDLIFIQELADNCPVLNNETILTYLESHKVLRSFHEKTLPKEVGIEKMFFHGEKVRDILENGAFANSYPVSVELTLTNQCNLKCVYCSDQDLRARQGADAYLSYDILSGLFQDLSEGGTKGIVFEGGGEPTMHPDFCRLVQAAKDNNLEIGLITNGTVHLPEEILKKFEWIRVSLDASNAEEYFSLKKVNCFERVLSNISYYARFCDVVGVGYVVTNRNMANIEELVLQLRETGISYVQFRPVVDAPELLPEEQDLRYLEFYRGSKFNVIIDGMQENIGIGNHGLPCTATSITSIISGDGSVYLCGRLNIYDWIPPIGNINKQSFAEIWRGSERMRQLALVEDASFCSQNCPQCRVSKFNQLFWRLSQTKSVHFI